MNIRNMTAPDWPAIKAIYEQGIVSVYVSTDHSRQGIGTALRNKLTKAGETAGIWTLQVGISRSIKPAATCIKRLVSGSGLPRADRKNERYLA